MPGARWRDFRLGDSAELLAEFILNSMAFTTRVPRQEDVGHDMLCAVIDHTDRLLKAGPFFTVQVKSTAHRIVYAKDYEVEWLKHQDNPLFICVSRRKRLCIDLYSTWNIHNGFLHRGAKRVILVPGGPKDIVGQVTSRDDRTEQVVPLGKPILHITAEDALDEQRIAALAKVLREWVEMDRENIVNRRAEMYWVSGPINYDTNILLSHKAEWQTAFYWHPENLRKCRLNFVRSATALRLVIRSARARDGESHNEIQEQVRDLERALCSHAQYLELLAKKALKEEIGLSLD